MNTPPKILVVDDTPRNVKLVADLLAVKGYGVVTADSGREGLIKLEAEQPDLVLLDVVMPEMSGYEVCRKIRENPATAMLPVIMVTALDPTEERVKGIEAGADDFLSKPINQPELLARVKSLLRIKELYDTVHSQSVQLGEWNQSLEGRVREQVEQLERLERLKRFFAAPLAEMIVNGGAEDPLKTHRRDLTVVYLDLRGFTAFAESAEPEEVMDILHEYHAAMGKLIDEYEGTLEHFAGDGMMIFFNDPVPVENPGERAVRMALAMCAQVKELTVKWRKLGHDLDFGVGIAQGYTTIGAIGFEGRWEYGAIGSVPNLAARLCGEAKPGEILVSQRLLGSVEAAVEAEPLGELALKGFHRPMAAYRVLGLKGVKE
jgi:class 3 adenylate cyclase/CheY-like chemotaxis protein